MDDEDDDELRRRVIDAFKIVYPNDTKLEGGGEGREGV